MATKKATPDVVPIFPRLTMPRALSPLQGFVDFVREQGVVGVAIGLVIGTQIKTLVDQFIASFVNPLLGLALPGKGDLAQKTFRIAINGKQSEPFRWGAFAAQFLSFMIVLAIVYFTVKSLKLEKLDKKKEK